MSAHAHSHGPAPKASRRVRVILASLLVPALLATIVGLVVLWPHDAPGQTIDPTADSAGIVYGTVTGPAIDDSHVPVKLQETGEDVVVQVPSEYVAAGVEIGDQYKILDIPDAVLEGTQYQFLDFKRDVPIAILAIAYALVVLTVARWRGLAAMAGLVISFVVVVKFTLPALLSGESVIGVALVTSASVMFVVLYLAHGFNARTSTALLGTFLGLVITTVLAAWAVDATKVTGLLDDNMRFLPAYAPNVDITGIALCGIVLAGLGVLNDVTITQASAVWELRAVSPDMSRLELFRRGMRIGRDHIASTVYTVAFAYLGAALPMLLIISLVRTSLGQTLTSGEIAQEVVRTLVGSIGLVLAIPATTAIAALAVGGSGVLTPVPEKGAPDDHDHDAAVPSSHAHDLAPQTGARTGATADTRSARRARIEASASIRARRRGDG
ncbi:YibE/F family protein [Sanguibacter antarcticus]|uniref:YibE/F-like protein n=1 Tax=Sanguibacter antarcticus TaxID=372484 RepID=A0A2A9E8N8_9MICO|nr:YibE/F family protein [Sanguibacter antarcticus]PFG34911.1 YibE/F-like protein [Sanguibacter antarcticus]